MREKKQTNQLTQIALRNELMNDEKIGPKFLLFFCCVNIALLSFGPLFSRQIALWLCVRCEWKLTWVIIENGPLTFIEWTRWEKNLFSLLLHFYIVLVVDVSIRISREMESCRHIFTKRLYQICLRLRSCHRPFTEMDTQKRRKIMSTFFPLCHDFRWRENEYYRGLGWVELL